MTCSTRDHLPSPCRSEAWQARAMRWFRGRVAWPVCWLPSPDQPRLAVSPGGTSRRSGGIQPGSATSLSYGEPCYGFSWLRPSRAAAGVVSWPAWSFAAAAGAAQLGRMGLTLPPASPLLAPAPALPVGPSGTVGASRCPARVVPAAGVNSSTPCAEPAATSQGGLDPAFGLGPGPPAPIRQPRVQPGCSGRRSVFAGVCGISCVNLRSQLGSVWLIVRDLRWQSLA